MTDSWGRCWRCKRSCLAIKPSLTCDADGGRAPCQLTASTANSTVEPLDCVHVEFLRINVDTLILDIAIKCNDLQ